MGRFGDECARRQVDWEEVGALIASGDAVRDAKAIRPSVTTYFRAQLTSVRLTSTIFREEGETLFLFFSRHPGLDVRAAFLEGPFAREP